MDKKAALKDHEEIYQDLKATGAEGWGAESFERRMQGWQKTLDWALPFFPQAPARVLDIGCGAGDSALPLAKLGYELSGFDISNTAVEWATEKFEQKNLKGSFQVVDLSKKLLQNFEPFDVIVDSATLHCILPPQREQAFENIRKLLKPTGIFLISSMVGDPKELDRIELFDSTKRLQKVKGLPYRYTPKIDDLRAELLGHSFKIQVEVIQNNPWWDHYNAILYNSKVKATGQWSEPKTWSYISAFFIFFTSVL